MKKIIYTIKLPLLALLLLSISSVAATTQWYQIDLVIFKSVSAAAAKSDLWSTQPANINTNNTIKLRPANGPTKAYRRLPRKLQQLNSEQRKLNNSGKYKVLLHIAWRQPVTQSRYGKALHFTSGPLYDGNIPAINGTIKIRRTRFLDTTLNLVYTAPANHGQYALKNIHLKENRRLRSKTLNYIDNSVLGVLIKIKPV